MHDVSERHEVRQVLAECKVIDQLNSRCDFELTR